MTRDDINSNLNQFFFSSLNYSYLRINLKCTSLNRELYNCFLPIIMNDFLICILYNNLKRFIIIFFLFSGTMYCYAFNLIALLVIRYKTERLAYKPWLRIIQHLTLDWRNIQYNSKNYPHRITPLKVTEKLGGCKYWCVRL